MAGILLEAVYHGFGGFLRMIWGSFDRVAWTARQDMTRSVMRFLPFQAVNSHSWQLIYLAAHGHISNQF